MSRRKRTHAQRAQRREKLRCRSEEKWAAAKIAALASPRPRPRFISFMFRGGAQFNFDIIPVGVPFNPEDPNPPENLQEQVMAAITSKVSGDA